jgi:hypothetical protein
MSKQWSAIFLLVLITVAGLFFYNTLDDSKAINSKELCSDASGKSECVKDSLVDIEAKSSEDYSADKQSQATSKGGQDKESENLNKILSDQELIRLASSYKCDNEKNALEEFKASISDTFQQLDTRDAKLFASSLGIKQNPELSQKENQALHLKTLENLIDNDATDSLVNLNYLNKCRYLPNELNCSQKYIDLISKNEKSNAAFWSNLADYYHRTDQQELTIEALTKAHQSEFFNDYSKQALSRMVNTIRTTDIKSNFQSAFAIASYFQMRGASEGNLTRLCTSFEQSRLDITDMCLNYAERIISQTNGKLMSTIGYQLKAAVHKHLGNTEAFQNAQAQLAASKEAEKEYIVGMILLTKDMSLHQVLVDNLLTLNERDAFRLLDEEARYRLSQPNYDPCLSLY